MKQGYFCPDTCVHRKCSEEITLVAHIRFITAAKQPFTTGLTIIKGHTYAAENTLERCPIFLQTDYTAGAETRYDYLAESFQTTVVRKQTKAEELYIIKMANKNFTPFPVLITERLTLRQLSIDDQQNIFALRSDKDVNKYLDRPVSKTIKDAIDFINRINDNIDKNNSIYWAITLTETSTFVGTICLFSFSNERSSCEIGYELLPEFQKQRIMQEAAEKVINYAFQKLQFQKIIASTHSGNQRSTGLLRKLNFIKSIEADKENPDLNIYALINSN